MDNEKIFKEFEKELEASDDLKKVDYLKIKYLSKKGLVSEMMNLMRDLPKEEKPLFGQKVNILKQNIQEKIDEKIVLLKQEQLNKQINEEKLDITLDCYEQKIGHLHPLYIIQKEIEDLFIGMGYQVASGPEVESDFYNFERANTAKDHPARDMQDTFYITKDLLLRTHTTAIQTRVLDETKNLPIKVICPGKVYRRDDDDATHSHQFMQIEGLVVGENLSVADLKATLQLMADKMFGKGRKIRFRPSYFPFTEPSFEVDVSCHMCDGKGCNVCKNTGYIEVLGAGMVHPKVLEDAGFDSQKYNGFAFGVGVERVAMLKYGIDDIRNFYVNDLRFNRLFSRFD